MNAVLAFITFILSAGLWLLPAPLIDAAVGRWVVSDPPDPADAAVVLGGNLEGRAALAAELYRSGLVKQLLIAEVRAAPARAGLVSLSEQTRIKLISAGIPPAAILPLGKNVSSTYDEARAAASWATVSGARSLIVPTDWYHTRRAKWVFSELAPRGVRVAVLALPPNGSDPGFSGDWLSLTVFAREAIKYFYYRIRYGG